MNLGFLRTFEKKKMAGGKTNETRGSIPERPYTSSMEEKFEGS